MKLIGAGFYTDAGDGAFSIAKLSVKRCGLHFEFLDNVAWRNVRGDNLIGVSRSGGGRAINQQIHPVTAGAVNCVTDDMSRLKGTIQSRVSRVRYAGRESNQRIRIAMDQRQFRDALLIQGLAQIGIRTELRIAASAVTVTVSCVPPTSRTMVSSRFSLICSRTPS